MAQRNGDGTVTIKTKGKTGRPGGTTVSKGTPGETPSLPMGTASPKRVRTKNRATPRNQPNTTES